RHVRNLAVGKGAPRSWRVARAGFAPLPTLPRSLLGGGERRRALLQDEVVSHLVERRGDNLAGRRLAGGLLDELDDQRLLHAVDHVGLDELVALLEQMGDAAVVSGRGDGEVD